MVDPGYVGYKGIDLSSTSNVTLKHIKIGGGSPLWIDDANGHTIFGSNFTGRVSIRWGGNHRIHENNIAGTTYLYKAEENTISNNNIKGWDEGVKLDHSNRNTISNNNVSGSKFSGIDISTESFNNTISGNIVVNCSSHGIMATASGNTISSNTIVNNAHDGIKSSVGHGTISNNTIVNNRYGIFLFSSDSNMISDNTIKNNRETGIWLVGSKHNTLFGNTVTNNTGHGIYFDGGEPYPNNTISGNTITKNKRSGIFLDHTTYHHKLFNNTIAKNGEYGICAVITHNIFSHNIIANNNASGIWLGSISQNNVISGNVLMNNLEGARTSTFCSANTFSDNTFMNNSYGVYEGAGGNEFYHNNFIHNTNQVYSPGANTWDDGYPSGGNYWSNYIGVDLYHGPYQNITGSDGIGDTPYIIDPNDKDTYPFMNQSGWKNTKLEFSLTPNPVYVGQTVTLLGNLTDRLNNPIIDTKIDVFVNEKFIASLFTNSTGWFTASAKVDTSGTYIVRVFYKGSETYNPSSHTETLIVYPKIDTRVWFTLSPNPAKVGQTITMLGNLTDIQNNPIGNAPNKVYVKTGAGPWQYKATITTNSSGWFKVSGTIPTAGTFQIAVAYMGSYKYNLSYHIETLIVNPSLISDIAPTQTHCIKE